MKTEILEVEMSEKDSQAPPADLEFEHYLFEVYLNDLIENEI